MSQKQSLKGGLEHGQRAQWLLWFGNQWARYTDILGTPTHMHSQAKFPQPGLLPWPLIHPCLQHKTHRLTGHSDPEQHFRAASREWWFFTQDEPLATRSCCLQQVRLGDREQNYHEWVISFSTSTPKNLETRQASWLLPVTCSSSSQGQTYQLVLNPSVPHLPQWITKGFVYADGCNFTVPFTVSKNQLEEAP